MRSTSPTGTTERIQRLTPKKRLIKLIGRAVFWWLIITSKLLGARSVECIGKALGLLYYRVSGKHRNLVIKQLTESLGDVYSSAEIKAMSRKVFVHFTSEALQFFRMFSMKTTCIYSMIETNGLENIQNALDKGKGCIVLTAHFGNWEVMARALTMQGWKVSVIARDSDDPGMTGITTRIRESAGYEIFDKDQPIIGAFRKLKKNEILGILPDQNDYDGIQVLFFGKKALSAVGPAVMSLKSGAALIPAFCEKTGRDKYKLTVQKAIEYKPTGNQEQDVHNLTQLVMNALEAGIRENPAQWLWLHDRWKVKPGVNNP